MTNRKPFSASFAKLHRMRIAAWLVLAFERVWPLLMPVLLLLGLVCALAWFGLFRALSTLPHLGVLAVFAFLLLFALQRFRHFQKPTRLDVDRRIEQASGLKFSPLEAQDDVLPRENITPFAKALWHEHQRRMAQQLTDLQIGLPHPDMPSRDPHALRAIAVLFIAVGFAVGLGAKSGRLHDTFDFRPPVDLSLIRVDAWVTPPDYTGQAPIYLTQNRTQDGGTITVPQGSVVHVRVINGGAAKLTIKAQDGSTQSLSGNQDDESNTTYQDILQHSATFALAARNYERQWHFDVREDEPLSIHFTAEPGRILNGSVELKYKIDDDYGATAAWAEFTPLHAEHDSDGEMISHPLYEAPLIKLRLPLHGKGEGRTVQDISGHPWAGSEVRVTLVAEDGAKHQARSETRTMTLPQKIFGNPLARAVVEQRRLLALDTFERNHVLDMLYALMIRPDDTIKNATHAMALRSAWTRLSLTFDDDGFRDVTDYMWQIALGIEGSMLDQAKAQLKQAQAALRDALRNGASPDEIERLMRELRQAMDNYMRALAEEQGQDTMSAEAKPDSKNMTPNELEEKLRQLEELAKTGNRAAAEELLSELEKLADNMRVSRGEGGNGQPGQGSQQNEMQKKLDELGDMMRRQQELLNETHRLENENRRGDKTPEEYGDALKQLEDKQKQLGQDLQQLQKDMEQKGLSPDEQLKGAGREMKNSEEALNQGRGDDSAKSQSEVLEALREGAKKLMDDIKQAQKKENGEGGEEMGTDPLGRKLDSAGKSNENSLPGENDMQRARRILDEIRRKLGEALTPELEKQYLERLLKFN